MSPRYISFRCTTYTIYGLTIDVNITHNINTFICILKETDGIYSFDSYFMNELIIE